MCETLARLGKIPRAGRLVVREEIRFQFVIPHARLAGHERLLEGHARLVLLE
jgi:hypothetical protein